MCKYNVFFVFFFDKIVVEILLEDMVVEFGSIVLFFCFVFDVKKIMWFKDGK